jgi:uncharacterized protein
VPNNNPEGHNQYTKSENRSIASGSTPGVSASSSGSTGSHGGTTGKSKRGFASMEPQMQREIASKGGQSQGKENNPGNFANDREKARLAGRKGGEAHGANR